MTQFSNKEMRLLKHFGCDHYVLEHLSRRRVYDYAVKEAFVRTESGCYINSLKRVYRAIFEDNEDIMSDFDHLIELEEETVEL